MAQRATSLGPKPSKFIYFLFFLVCFCSFPFLCFVIQKKPCFPPRKGHFCLFLSVSLCSSLAFFGLPLFQFFFLCLSLLLVLFPSFLSLFCFLVFVSFFPLLSSLLLFHEKNNIRKIDVQSFSSSFFLFLGFLSSFLFEIPFSYLCLFCCFKVMFLFNIIVFGFKKFQVEKHQFLVKRGVATKRGFFMNLCFAKCEKLSFFLGPCFWQILVDVQKTL